MKQGRSAKQFYHFINLIGIPFSAYLIITLSIYSHAEGSLPGYGAANNNSLQIPAKKISISVIDAAFSESDFLSDTEINHVINESFKKIRQLPSTGFFALALPLISISVFVYCMKYYVREPDKQGSVLASSLGGHAPPAYV